VADFEERLGIPIRMIYLEAALRHDFQEYLPMTIAKTRYSEKISSGEKMEVSGAILRLKSFISQLKLLPTKSQRTRATAGKKSPTQFLRDTHSAVFSRFTNSGWLAPAGIGNEMLSIVSYEQV